MKFLEIREGFSIKVDSIECVESIDQFSCRLHTENNSYDANFPYSTMLQLLSIEEDREVETVKLEPRAMNALDSLGHHFAG